VKRAISESLDKYRNTTNYFSFVNHRRWQYRERKKWVKSSNFVSLSRMMMCFICVCEAIKLFDLFLPLHLALSQPARFHELWSVCSLTYKYAGWFRRKKIARDIETCVYQLLTSHNLKKATIYNKFIIHQVII
jgi:hypothetical protein